MDVLAGNLLWQMSRQSAKFKSAKYSANMEFADLVCERDTTILHHLPDYGTA